MRILLVEDHADTLEVTAKLLTRRGYEVVSVTTAAEAEQLCETEKFDVMICDLMLPDRDGWTLGAVAKRHGITAMALSALAMPADVEQSRQSGFVTHLIKPAHFEAIEAAIETFVGSRPQKGNTPGLSVRA